MSLWSEDVQDVKTGFMNFLLSYGPLMISTYIHDGLFLSALDLWNYWMKFKKTSCEMSPRSVDVQAIMQFLASWICYWVMVLWWFLHIFVNTLIKCPACCRRAYISFTDILASLVCDRLKLLPQSFYLIRVLGWYTCHGRHHAGSPAFIASLTLQELMFVCWNSFLSAVALFYSFISSPGTKCQVRHWEGAVSGVVCRMAYVVCQQFL